jgi:uncharacterized membrane protein
MKKRHKEGVIETFAKPFIPEFKLKDVLQVVIGASILAVPIGFTQETWDLGESMPMSNVLGLLMLSLAFVSMFTYYHYHRRTDYKHWEVYVKRVFSTYVFSFLVVAIILGLIQKTPWGIDALLAFKRIVIVTFPASMSGVIADTLK